MITRRLLITTILLLNLCGDMFAQTQPTNQPDNSAKLFQNQITPFFAQYCVRCHNSTKKQAELDLGQLDASSANGDKSVVWKSIFNKLKTGEMPPKNAKQPRPQQREQVLLWIRTALQKAGKPIDTSRWNHPSTGNWVNHELLFSGKTSAKPVTVGRLWRITGQAYEEFMQQKNVTFRLGFRTYGPGRLRTPWELPAQEGLRDYASSHRIGEPEIEAHLRNSTKVARAMIYQIRKRRGIVELEPILKRGKEATAKQINDGAKATFEGMLGRFPTAQEQKRYSDFLRKNLNEFGAEKALELLLVATLFHPEVLYRVELPGTGNRGMMAPNHLARALAYSLTDREPDESLQKAVRLGKLTTRQEVHDQVMRILNDETIKKPRILRFFQEYFGYPAAVDVFKDETTRKAVGLPGRDTWYPSFFVSDTDQLILWVLKKDKNVLRELLTTPKTFVLTGTTREAERVVNNKKGFRSAAQVVLDIYEIDMKRSEWTDQRPFEMAKTNGHSHASELACRSFDKFRQPRHSPGQMDSRTFTWRQHPGHSCHGRCHPS